MERRALKVVGAQGQGINSIGEILAKGLKRTGYCVFGYKEYMSLIKGGHSSYQLDVSGEYLESTESNVDLLVTVNHHGLEQNLRDVKKGGVIVHNVPDWEFEKQDQEFLDENGITVICLPVHKILRSLKAKTVLGNMVLTAFAWRVLGQDVTLLKELTKEQFGHKGEKIVAMNHACIDEAARYFEEHAKDVHVALPDPEKSWTDALVVTGSEAMGLGLVHAGCRVYVGYPMTPSSPLLSYIAGLQNETHMVIKQAEDEITAAQMMSGAMCMGTRAATGTSGGGFDLMTETVSLNGMIENPSLFILAQRPGPATGLPTWTAQGDLLLATNAAHGEFPRLVLSVSDAKDCFALMSDAFNLAEEYQIPVIVLTDKQIAEALFTTQPFDQKSTEIRRGKLIMNKGELSKLQSTDRYNPDVPDGISKRWLPGSEAATYCAQGDEHNDDGTVDETGENARKQMEKRMKKKEALEKALPEPEFFGAESPDVLLVSWGSNKGVILDALKSPELSTTSIGYLHYTYLWPLKTKRCMELARQAKKVVLVECNEQGQLGLLLRQQSGIEIPERILKYDGRPFFYDELSHRLTSLVS